MQFQLSPNVHRGLRVRNDKFEAKPFGITLEAKDGCVGSTDGKLQVVIRRGQWMAVVFYRSTLSNFVRMAHGECPVPVAGGDPIHFSCPESLFKTACLLLHQDGISEETVLGAAKATNPKDVKLSTARLDNFQVTKWNEISRKVMEYAQRARLQELPCFDFFKALQRLAEAHEVSDVHFAEAAGDNDLLWGTGRTVEETVSDLSAYEGALTQYLLRQRGHNRLGTALDAAFDAASRFESVEAYRAHFQSLEPLFALA